MTQDTKTYDERELEDNYNLYYGYLYVIDNKVCRYLGDNATAGYIRNKHKYNSIKNCDIEGRDIWHWAIKY